MKTCGYSWQPFDAGFHFCRRPFDHEGDHECKCGFYRPMSGTPAGGPGVLEDGGSAAGEPTPPAPGPHADPPSPDLRAALTKRLQSLPVLLYDNQYPIEALPKSELLDLLARHPQTDDGAGAPLADRPASPPDAATSSPAPSSLTAEMQVERCRVLLDQWRKDRSHIPLGSIAWSQAQAYEAELREALEGS